MRPTLEEALAKLRDPSVTKLDQRLCNFDDAEAQTLAVALPASQVTWLDLGSNNLGDAGMQALAVSLPASQVTWLELGFSSFGAAGAQALAAALPASQITLLDLAGNNLGDAGIQALALALPASQVTSLNLQHVNLSDAGAQALADALPASQVTSLHLTGNNISDALLEQIDKACKHNLKSAEKAAAVLLSLTALNSENWQVVCDHVASASAVIQKKAALMDAPMIQYFLETTADKAHAQGLPCRDFVLKAFPFPQAMDWLEARGETLSMRDLLNEDGTIPQDRLLCQGGVAVLFKQTELWENNTQVGIAYNSLPESDKSAVQNIHQLKAALGRPEPTTEQGR